MLLPPAASRHFLKLGSDGAAAPGRVAVALAVAAPGGGGRAAPSSCTALLLGPGGSVALAVAAPGGGGHATPSSYTAGRHGLLPWYVGSAAPAVAAPGGGVGGRAAPSSRRRCTASGDNAAPSSDAEIFRAAMKQAKERCRAMALVGAPTQVLVQIAHSVDEARELLGHMLMKQPVSLPHDLFEEMVGIGTTFVEVDGQCREGYLRADAMLAAMNGLKRMSAIFNNSVDDLPQYPEGLPISSRDVVERVYFRDQSISFVRMLYVVKCKWWGVPFDR